MSQYGAEIINKLNFPDHYYFSSEDLNEILIDSVQNDYLILVTEKDMVKVKRLLKDERILYLKIEMEFMSGEFELEDAIKKVLNLDSY